MFFRTVEVFMAANIAWRRIRSLDFVMNGWFAAKCTLNTIFRNKNLQLVRVMYILGFTKKVGKSIPAFIKWIYGNLFLPMIFPQLAVSNIYHFCDFKSLSKVLVWVLIWSMESICEDGSNRVLIEKYLGELLFKFGYSRGYWIDPFCLHVRVTEIHLFPIKV